MHIFQVHDFRLSLVTIIADDVQHASMTMLLGLYEGLGHWPTASYAIGPWNPPESIASDILRQIADEQLVGGFAHHVDNGWEIIRRDQEMRF